jgi:hypothetical protein
VSPHVTPKENESYCSHNEGLLGGNGGLLKLARKQLLREQGKETTLGYYSGYAVVRVAVCALNFPWAPKQKAPELSHQLVQMRNRKGGRVGLGL